MKQVIKLAWFMTNDYIFGDARIRAKCLHFLQVFFYTELDGVLSNQLGFIL